VRSAIIGSIVEALRAGKYPANRATAPSITTIPTNVSGSVGAVLNRREAIRRATANEAMIPTAMPASASRGHEIVWEIETESKPKPVEKVVVN